MDEDLRESYHHVEGRLFHEGRLVTPSFIEANNMLPSFQAVGLEPFLTLNEPIYPRFVVELYHSLKVKRDEEERWELFFKDNLFCTLSNRKHVNVCTAYMLYYLTIKRKFHFTLMILYRMEEIKSKCDGPMPFAMLLTRLYNHILQTNPQAIAPLARFTFHERVMNPLDISRNHTKERRKKVASPSASSSSSSSSDDNEAPPFHELYKELPDNEDLTNAQRDKR
ncbi:hypothetical protein Tco_0774682 [Tanacetum coccineum]|uniref:Uncharacterized protein n=1 Tax=Tanacetum coccineum TaxID=301880 RepID=A0ABQ4ZRY2_9ASTR